MKRAAMILSIVFISLALTACNGEVDNKIIKNISELRQNLYTCEGGDYRASVITGYKEEPFVVDGVSGAKAEFAVISIEDPALDHASSYTYTLKAGSKEYSGILQPHPFGKLLIADVKNTVSGDTLALSVSKNGTKTDMTMQSALKPDMIGWEDALKIGTNELKKSIDSLYLKDRSFNAEVYVRFINGKAEQDNNYYWYVAFVSSDKTTYAVLIEPSTRAIMAKR